MGAATLEAQMGEVAEPYARATTPLVSRAPTDHDGHVSGDSYLGCE